MEQIDKDVRKAMLSLIGVVTAMHPTAGQRETHNIGDPSHRCRTCHVVDVALDLLDADQREYGPEIDESDRSWLRGAR